MRTMRLSGATGIALGALLFSACVYDRAPGRATATVWDTRDDAGEGMEERDARVVEVTTAQESTPARDVEPAEPGDAPLVEDATPEAPRVADPALREVAAEPTPSEPLIAEGMLRDESCPMALEGAQVALVERPEGPALTFEASGADDVEELQSRVMALALTRDDERVEVPAGQTRAALAEEPGPDVQPPGDTEMQEGGEADMPFNLPQTLTRAEQAEDPEPTFAERFAPLPEAEVTVELTDEGADVLFEPLSAEQRDELARGLEGRAGALQEGACPADTMSMLTSTPG